MLEINRFSRHLRATFAFCAGKQANQLALAKPFLPSLVYQAISTKPFLPSHVLLSWRKTQHRDSPRVPRASLVGVWSRQACALARMGLIGQHLNEIHQRRFI
jgi:hypothetical protein